MRKFLHGKKLLEGPGQRVCFLGGLKLFFLPRDGLYRVLWKEIQGQVGLHGLLEAVESWYALFPA